MGTWTWFHMVTVSEGRGQGGHAMHAAPARSKQKKQRLREQEWVAYQKANAGRKRLSTLAHVHEDTKNVSVHGGGEREGATAGVVA